MVEEVIPPPGAYGNPNVPGKDQIGLSGPAYTLRPRLGAPEGSPGPGPGARLGGRLGFTGVFSQRHLGFTQVFLQRHCRGLLQHWEGLRWA